MNFCIPPNIPGYFIHLPCWIFHTFTLLDISYIYPGHLLASITFLLGFRKPSFKIVGFLGSSTPLQGSLDLVHTHKCDFHTAITAAATLEPSPGYDWQSVFPSSDVTCSNLCIRVCTLPDVSLAISWVYISVT